MVISLGFPGGSVSKESTCQCRRLGFDPWVRKIPWKWKWQLTLVFLPGESHGQRSLVGYSPWSRKESDTTEQLNHHHRYFLNIILMPFRFLLSPPEIFKIFHVCKLNWLCVLYWLCIFQIFSPLCNF